MEPAPLKDGLFEGNASVVKATSWVTWFTKLKDRTPTISIGSSAPVSVPDKAGDIFCDTVGQKVYIAVGTGSSADWKVMN